MFPINLLQMVDFRLLCSQGLGFLRGGFLGCALLNDSLPLAILTPSNDVCGWYGETRHFI